MIARATRAKAGAALAVLVLLVGAQGALAAPSGSGKQPASGHRNALAQRRTAPNQGGGVVRFNREAYSYHASTDIHTEANRYQAIVLQAPDGALVARLHAANPHLKVLVYQDALFSSPQDPLGLTTCTNYLTDAVTHPTWFLKDLRGLPILARAYSGNALMDPAGPGYEQACVGHAVSQAKRFGFDGIFMDGVTAWVQFAFPAGIASPLYPTPDLWQQAMTPFLAYFASQAHANGLLAMANIGGSRITPGLWQRWTSLLDGSEEESWTDAGLGLSDQILDWPTKLANVAWSEAHHKYTFVHSYNTTAAGNAYGLASQLLVAGGWSSYSTTNRDSAAPDLWRGVYVTAERLGAPAGSYSRLPNGVYVRRFAHGIVLVNPTGGSSTRFSLRGRYKLATGATVSSMAMAPTSGSILLKAKPLPASKHKHKRKHKGKSKKSKHKHK